MLGHLRVEDTKERAGIMVDRKRDPSHGMVRSSALNHLYFGSPFISCGIVTFIHPWSNYVELMEMTPVKVQE